MEFLGPQTVDICLSPRGESGLKWPGAGAYGLPVPSLPTRGEWIEIRCGSLCRPWHRGLSPRGESGLKYRLGRVLGRAVWSLPTRGEWIEMILHLARRKLALSLPTRGEWIEICSRQRNLRRSWSLPTRGEWIEIQGGGRASHHQPRLSPRGESGLKLASSFWVMPFSRRVSPHAGRVD